MGIFRSLFGEKNKNESTIHMMELAKVSIPKNATVVYQSEIPEWTLIGNLIFEKKYKEAIELGKKLLVKETDSAGVHINLMVAYFKTRNTNPEHFNLSTYHAKQAIICGHNTGYAHERLVINLEKIGMINQAIQLCDIVLSENYNFSSHGCGNKDEFSHRKEKLLSKLSKAIDNESEKLFNDNELKIIYDNIRLNNEQEEKNVKMKYEYSFSKEYNDSEVQTLKNILYGNNKN